MCGLPLEDIWLIRDYTLKDSLSLSSYCLLVASKIGVALHAHLSLPHWHLFWLELVPSCRSYHSLYEQICPAAPMFLVHCFLVSFYFLCLLYSFCPLFLCDPWALREGAIQMSHLGLSFPQLLALSTLASCGSLCQSLPTTNMFSDDGGGDS